MKVVLKFIGYTLGAIVIALGGLIMYFAPPSSSADSQSRFENRARSACITSVRRQLHNPRSASWVNSTQWPVTLQDGGLYAVSMTYRAENAFGGTVMESARCIVRRDEAEAFAIRIN